MMKFHELLQGLWGYYGRLANSYTPIHLVCMIREKTTEQT